MDKKKSSIVDKDKLEGILKDDDTISISSYIADAKKNDNGAYMWNSVKGSSSKDWVIDSGSPYSNIKGGTLSYNDIDGNIYYRPIDDTYYSVFHDDVRRNKERGNVIKSQLEKVKRLKKVIFAAARNKRHIPLNEIMLDNDVVVEYEGKLSTIGGPPLTDEELQRLNKFYKKYR